MADFKKGDAVEWNSPQGKVAGTVVRQVSAPMEIAGHHVAATPEEPQYLVKSDRTGAEAVHKPGALRRRG